MPWFSDRRMIRAVARVGEQIPSGPAMFMVIAQQPPTTAVAGAALTTQPNIAFIDEYNNPVSGAGIVVTATPSVGTISGSTTAVGAAGYAAFTTLTMDAIAGTPTGYRSITFSAPGFASVVSTGILFSSTIGLLAGYGLHLDAQQLNYAEGAAVTTWPDLSGNGRHFVLPSGGPPWTGPTFCNGYLFHKPGVRFNGTTHQLESDATPFAAATFPQTLIIVLKWLATTFAEAYRGAIAFQSGGNGYGYGVRGAGHNFERMEPNTNVFQPIGNQTPTLVPQAAVMVARSVLVSGSGVLVYRNGVLVTGAGVVVPSLATTKVSLGALTAAQADAATARLGTPTIGEVIWYPFELTAAEITSMYTDYLNPRWLLSTATSAETACGTAPAPVNPAPTRGPILLEDSVIDGVTIHVYGWVAGADITSTDTQQSILIFTFSEPIKRFALTLNTAIDPSSAAMMIIGANNYQGSIYAVDYVPGAGTTTRTIGERSQINETTTGFTAVIVRRGFSVSGSGSGAVNVQDCRFSKMSDP